MTLAPDLLAILVFGISGGLAAVRMRLDIVGVAIHRVADPLEARRELPAFFARISQAARDSAGDLVLGVDGLMGQDEVMIKPLAGVKPRGVAGATISGEGALVLVLELHELLEGVL